MNAESLSVREIQETDIELIADYWSGSDSNHLVGMGVDLTKVPPRFEFIAMLSTQVALPREKRQSYCTIWELNGTPIGHCNVNKIRFGREAFMHLHIWSSRRRRHGMGVKFVRHSLRYFFERLELQDLYCEPYALNLAPSAVLAKAGFLFVKEYTTVPGTINFEQRVKQWHMSRSRYDSIASDVAKSTDGPTTGRGAT